MDAEQLHFPDFGVPDFTQPALERADLAQPGFVLPNPFKPDPATMSQLPLWPGALEQPNSSQPDPFLPDLTDPDRPADLTQPASDTHMLPDPRYEPEVVLAQRPGELDPAAMETLLASPDREE